MHDQSAFTILVEKNNSGKRLDLLVSSRISVCSRSAAARLIRNGKIRVKGTIEKPGYRVRTGDVVYGQVPPPESVSLSPEPIEIEILFEDEYLIVVNKQPGMVVHPASGRYTGTLVNGLLYHYPEIEGIGGESRPGIVHRLDKDTSGAIVVAKKLVAQDNLVHQFKSRKVKKEYLALVYGDMESNSGKIILPIGRHPVHRKKMSTQSQKHRDAETTWRVREHFEGATLLELKLKTGRTHQIRVHCAALNHSVVGDSVYGRRKKRKKVAGKENLLKVVRRQMLHAWRLGFTHPATARPVSFEAPIPQDMKDLINALRQI